MPDLHWLQNYLRTVGRFADDDVHTILKYLTIKEIINHYYFSTNMISTVYIIVVTCLPPT